MAEKIIMPQGGQDLQFGTVVRWLKDEGDPVSKGELVCEVETEKAVFEVTAPRDGLLIKILKGDGEEAEVLSAIAYIGDVGEKIEIEAEVQPQTEKKSAPVIHSSTAVQRLPGEKVRISPKARKYARDHDIDITKLTSNRPDGKITTEIVQAAIRAEGPSKTLLDTSGGRMIKMGNMQRIAARRLSRYWNEAPHFFVTVVSDVTDLLKMREAHNRKSGDVKISVNDLIVKAVAVALKEIPEVNASYFDRDTIILWDDVHIGIAVSTEGGLLVPVLANADQLSLMEISARTRALLNDAHSGKFVSDVSSRFTISNLGMHRVDRFSAIINPPESAILAVASAQKKALVNEKEEVVVCDVVELTLSFDHRVGDGVLAAKFLNRIKDQLEEPAQLWKLR